MRIPVVSDIHRNGRAFDAVLEDLRTVSPDTVITLQRLGGEWRSSSRDHRHACNTRLSGRSKKRTIGFTQVICEHLNNPGRR